MMGKGEAAQKETEPARWLGQGSVLRHMRRFQASLPETGSWI